MNTIAVELKNVSKKYTLYHEKPTLMEVILTAKKKEEFWALKNVSLKIKKGERIGIIGPNGSGKTTLMEIVAGITTPTEGKVFTNGKLVSLIELEAGFHPELTGEENVWLNGLLLGMSKDEIRRKFDKIVNFADLRQFIDTPFYTYSEGMKLRLGFSIVAHTDPDILLLDENLSVGDQKFREKSYAKIQNFFKKGKTVILVSHQEDTIKGYSERVLWFDQGKLKKSGATKRIMASYGSY